MKLNLPNKLIIIRFILAIIVVGLLISVYYTSYFEYKSFTGLNQNPLSIVAFCLFVIAAYTDYLDGHLARKNNQITNFGKLFDPIADKILVNSVLIIFAWLARIPIWLVVIFIVRDLLVDGLRMFLVSKNVVVAADKLGKQKTLWQFLGLSLLFLVFPNVNNVDLYYLALIPLFIAALFSVISGFNYYKNNWSYIIKEESILSK